MICRSLSRQPRSVSGCSRWKSVQMSCQPVAMRTLPERSRTARATSNAWERLSQRRWTRSRSISFASSYPLGPIGLSPPPAPFGAPPARRPPRCPHCCLFVTRDAPAANAARPTPDARRAATPAPRRTRRRPPSTVDGRFLAWMPVIAVTLNVPYRPRADARRSRAACRRTRRAHPRQRCAATGLGQRARSEGSPTTSTGGIHHAYASTVRYHPCGSALTCSRHCRGRRRRAQGHAPPDQGADLQGPRRRRAGPPRRESDGLLPQPHPHPRGRHGPLDPEQQ